MSSDESWKARYLREVASAQAREKNWHRERHTLAGLLVQTSMASEGHNAHLDALLTRLRELMQKGAFNLEGLRQLQARIDRQLALLDDHKQTRLGKLRTSMESLLADSRRHPAIVAERGRLERLAKALRRSRSLSEELPDLFCELVSLLQQALAMDSLVPPEAESSTEPATAAGVEPPACEESDHDQRLRFARRVSELLGHMLSQLALDPRSHARALALRDHLSLSNSWDDLRASLSDVAELMIAVVQRGQQEFEAFLKRLDDRLLALQEHFSDQSDTLATVRTAAAAFDQTLRTELLELGELVDTSEDVRELKRSVTDHIDAIAAAMEQHRSAELKREQQLEAQIDAMKQKLAAVEVHSEQIKEQLREERSRALTDVLTQLPNREAWQERLEFEIRRWQRYRNPVSVAVLDIDRFKRINDSYGHKAGDRVIQLLAKTLAERLRNTDFVARYGGEEFVVVMPETAPENARTVLDMLRAHIAQLPFHFRGDPVSITFSGGLAQLSDGDDADSVFDRADRALYQAKAAGRNRVEIATWTVVE
ncbi:MAG: diguanylate cyclase [Marinobacter sp.]|uniref:diguanylate cyclase domain-containing protein n=1 Tax=Marinobacter sp. TaxID=50741 RepID=UPI00299EFC2E|nr:diguanylate cyclase [Marinobacter sp.]MDX1755171.1 diguanylate cyclase [Marinobacter sp.]